MKNKLFPILLVMLAAFPVAVFGQANGVDAAVNGYITDTTKRAIVGAQVKLTNVATGTSQVMTTDGNGYYRFPLVPVGTYTLVASAAGFQINTTQGIILNVGQEARLDTSLAVGNESQTVEVDAGPDILATDHSRCTIPSTMMDGKVPTRRGIRVTQRSMGVLNRSTSKPSSLKRTTFVRGSDRPLILPAMCSIRF